MKDEDGKPTNSPDCLCLLEPEVNHPGGREAKGEKFVFGWKGGGNLYDRVSFEDSRGATASLQSAKSTNIGIRNA